MALKDLIPPRHTPASERPPGITCEKYLRAEGRRCAHYLASGACALASEFMCVEWLKVNGPDAQQLTNPSARSASRGAHGHQQAKDPRNAQHR